MLPTRIETCFFKVWSRQTGSTEQDYEYLITWPDGSTERRPTIPNKWNEIAHQTHLADQAERMAKLDASIEASRQPLGRVA